MIGSPRLRLLLMASLLLVAVTGPAIVLAQEDARIQVSSVNTEAFPRISIYVSVSDGSGNHVSGLQRINFSVFEDDNPVSGLVSEEVRVGTRQIYVVNTTPELKRKGSLEVSLLEAVRQSLIAWWSSFDSSLSGIDDLTLLTTEGPLVEHSSLVAELAAVMDQLDPSFEPTISVFDSLSQALNYASDPLPQPGMAKQLIFITPPIETLPELSIANTIARANEIDTSIHVVIVDLPEAELQEQEGLRQIAEATGGQFLIFDPAEGMDRLANALVGFRSAYQLAYDSGATTSGPHSVKVQVSSSSVESSSEARSYQLLVLPPEVTLIQPPTEIHRQPQDPSRHLETLSPASQAIRVLINFPDNHLRPIVSSHLLVDGEIVDRQLSQPFDRFDWSLDSYFQSESHSIQAVIKDSLGLEAATVEFSVFVEVAQPPSGLTALLPAMEPLLKGLGLLIVALVLVSVLLSVTRRSSSRSRQAKAPSGPRLGVGRASLSRRMTQTPPEAYLVLSTDDERTAPNIPLTGADVTLGREGTLATVALDDPSVSGIHARLIRLAAGDYMLRDQGSSAGSWINYELVPDEGQILRHGDLIHLGRMAFRFVLKAPPPPHEIRIYPLNGEDEIQEFSPGEPET